MKKILVLLVIISLTLPAFAQGTKKTRLDKCFEISRQAEARKDSELFKDYAMCVYRTNKKGIVPKDEIKVLDNQALGLIVKYYTTRYSQTQNKKDFEKAQKYAFAALKNRTNDPETIYNTILLFALALDEENMLLTYDYWQKISPEDSARINSEFGQNIEKVRETKSLLKHNRNYYMKKRIGTILYSVGYDMPSYAMEAGDYHKKEVPPCIYSIENLQYKFEY
ncbi:MAG TPA: hypothetical protein PLG15_00820 [Candidatus Gastranaerophilaceae bacterium]|nr:hypothetical protein [Candidatus Gastranaerophilaceae bacterium]HPT40910.1 hypothetical protein [Candidatus Gastranaerophilaceae bacterium]